MRILMADFENFPSRDIIKHNYNSENLFLSVFKWDEKRKNPVRKVVWFGRKTTNKVKTSGSSIAIKHRQKTLNEDKSRNIIF
jgi:hypothetical protein